MNLNGYIKMLRIGDWINFYPFIPLIGAVLSNPNDIDFLLIGTVYLIFFCTLGYGFVINNYYDVEIDKKHKDKVILNKNPLISGDVTSRGTLLLCGILIVIPLIFSFFLSRLGFLLTLTTILLFTLYSERRVRLKERYFVDIITHGIMSGFIPFLAGFTLAGGKLNIQILLISLLFMIIGCEALLTHQINDYKDDLGNTDTTVVRTGIRNGWAMLIVFVILSMLNLWLIISIYRIDLLLSVGAFSYLLAYPIYMCRGEIKNDIYNRSSIE